MPQQILVVCPLVFFASLVDSIAGGGGLISLPAYYLTGMDSHFAIASNKFSSSVGTAFSTERFLKSGNLNLRVSVVSAAAALIGSLIGARLALILEDRFLRILMLILLPVVSAAVLCRRKDGRGQENRFDRVPKRLALFWSLVLGFFLGAYDGFFGPGTGTFLILGYVSLLRFDYKTACGNAKVVNLTSNLAALVTFVAAGKIQYLVAVPAALCAAAGHWIGAGLAIRSGEKFIRPVMVFALALLFGKITWDFFF